MTVSFRGPTGRGTVERLTFSHLVSVPENHFAQTAVRQAAARLTERRNSRAVNPLFLHGQPGTGKTHLVWALAHEVAHRCPDLAIRVVAVDDLGSMGPEVNDCDLLVLEDLHHLASRLIPSVVRLFDQLHAHRQQLVFTAAVGPNRLDELPSRLTSRLASGLVVGLGPLSAASRLQVLVDRAERRQLSVSRAVLAWLADHLRGGRQLEGALNRLETLVRSRPAPLDVAAVAEHFHEEVTAARPTIERVARRVGRHFRVEPRQLQSRCRQPGVLRPRQLGMYLARQLTASSLAEIGTYFGGRDHSTVLHACRKIEQVLKCDAVLAGTVRQLHADLA